MITARLRTVLFVLACGVLGCGLLLLLAAVTKAPPTEADIERLGRFSSDMMSDAGKGLRLILLGACLTMVIVLWNASALSRDWLGVLSYAFKGLGALAAFLLVALFLQQQRLQGVVEVRRAREILDQKEADEAKQNVAEADRARRDRNRERVEALLRNLAEQRENVAVRTIAVMVAASHLRDDEMMSLGLAQALHGVVLFDTDESVRTCARQIVYPGISTTKLQQIPDFPEALVSLLETEPDLLKDALFQRYSGLLRTECRQDTRLIERLAALETKKNGELLKDEKKLSAELEAPLDGSVANATDAATVNATQVIAAATGGSAETQQKAIDLLQKTDGGRLEVALKLLAPELKSTVPPRVYVHVAEPNDRTSDAITKMREGLREMKVRGQRPIVPGIQVVGKRAPDVTEVRYYAGEDNRNAAEQMAGFLRQSGIKNVRTSQDKPTESDLRQSRDIGGHFEVWFARGALK